MRIAVALALFLSLTAEDWQDPLGEVDWTPPFDPMVTESEAPPEPAPPSSPSPSSASSRGRAPATSSRAIAAMAPDACIAALRATGIAFEAVDPSDAPGVTTPIRLRSTIAGIEVSPRRSGGPQSILDCRLALAIAAWAPALRDAGVTRIEHYSCFRAHALVAGTSTPSAHAAGLAIDAAIFYLDDGRVLDIARDWGDRSRGADPCAERETDSTDAALLRTLVCGAATREIFEIVLTPHYDAAHANHVHLEVRPDVEWSYVH